MPFIAFIIGLLTSVGGYFGYTQLNQPEALSGFDDPFLSIQLAPNPSNGDCLSTDGTDNIWDTCASGGGGGGLATTSPFTAGDLVQVVDGGTVRSISTSSLGISTSQWTTTGSNIYYNTGNVGIGTSTPASKLTIYQSAYTSAGGITFDSVNGGAINNGLYRVAASQMALRAGGNDVFFDAGDIRTSSGPRIRGAAGASTTPTYAWNGDPNTGMYNPSADTLGFTTKGSERLTVSSIGNVGVGTTTPTTALHVIGTTTTSVLCLSTDTCRSTWPSGGGGITSLNSQTGSSQTFATGTATGIGLTITSGSDIHTFTPTVSSGYNIPLTASTTNWNGFWDTPSTRITAGTGIDWSGNTLNGVYTAGDGITLTGEDFDCDTASGSVFGCLTSTDWNTFNGKQDTITAGDALTLTGTDIDFDGGATPGGSLGGTWASPTIDDLFLLNTGDSGTGNYSFSGGTFTVSGTSTLATTTITGPITSSYTGTSTFAGNVTIAGNLSVTGGLEVQGALGAALVSLIAAAIAVATITFTNKRIQPRTASSTTSSNLSPNLSTANVYYRTTQTATLTIDAPTGTPVIGEVILMYIDSAGAQTINFDATYIPFGAAFPSTTTAGKTLMVSAQYNGTNWKTLWANAV